MGTLNRLKVIVIAALALGAMSGCLSDHNGSKANSGSASSVNTMASSSCTVSRISTGVRLDCSGVTADLNDGATGVAGGEVVRIISPTNDPTIQLMVAGPLSDIANVTIAKSISPNAPAVTISRPSANVRFLSLKGYFSGSELGSNTSIDVIFPETTSQTDLTLSQRPIAYRYSSAYGAGTATSSIANNGGVLTVTVPGFTASQISPFQLIW